MSKCKYTYTYVYIKQIFTVLIRLLAYLDWLELAVAAGNAKTLKDFVYSECVYWCRAGGTALITLSSILCGLQRAWEVLKISNLLLCRAAEFPIREQRAWKIKRVGAYSCGYRGEYASVCECVCTSVPACVCNWSFINVKLQVNNLAQFVRGAWLNSRRKINNENNYLLLY